jgi:hypothetical protein
VMGIGEHGVLGSSVLGLIVTTRLGGATELDFVVAFELLKPALRRAPRYSHCRCQLRRVLAKVPLNMLQKLTYSATYSATYSRSVAGKLDKGHTGVTDGLDDELGVEALGLFGEEQQTRQVELAVIGRQRFGMLQIRLELADAVFAKGNLG